MARKAGRNEESCYACRYLSSIIPGVTPGEYVDIEFENAAGQPVCMLEQIDFVSELGLDDGRGMNDKVDALRTGSIVQIGNIFFRIIPADDTIPRSSMIDNDPEEALRLTRRYGIDDLTDIDEDCAGAVRCALLLQGVPAQVIDQQTVSAEDYEALGDDLRNWEDLIPADSTLRYLYAGTQWEAIVEPFLSSHGCQFGINKITNQPFSSYFHDLRVERLAKELWGNDVVLQAIEHKEPLTTCSHCGFPMQKARGEILLPYVVGTEEVELLGETVTLSVVEHRRIDFCMWCSEEASQESMLHLHLQYMSKARELMRKKAHDVNIIHFPVNINPRSLAERLHLKLYAFFCKMNTSGSWCSEHYE